MALENGELQPPAVEAAAPLRVVERSARTAEKWARALGLRPGSTRAPTPKHLEPVVEAWARQHGLPEPSHREVGLGLSAAGLVGRCLGASGRHVLLHRHDARRLWDLAREAWAPAVLRGDPLQERKRLAKHWRDKQKLRHHPPQPPAAFHEELARASSASRPLVDSFGRVWPSPPVAARVLGGSRKALDNSLRAHRNLLTLPTGAVPSDPLLSAIAQQARWQGCFWRYLTPAEVRAIPQGTATGQRLPGLGWGLVCVCGAQATLGPDSVLHCEGSGI